MLAIIQGAIHTAPFTNNAGGLYLSMQKDSERLLIEKDRSIE